MLGIELEMEFSNILLSANLAVMSFVAVSLWNQASSVVDEAKRIGALNFDSPFEPPPAFLPSSSSEEESYGLRESAKPKNVSEQSSGALAKTEIGTVNSAGFYFVDPKEGEKDFYSIGISTTTDKGEMIFLHLSLCRFLPADRLSIRYFVFNLDN